MPTPRKASMVASLIAANVCAWIACSGYDEGLLGDPDDPQRASASRAWEAWDEDGGATTVSALSGTGDAEERYRGLLRGDGASCTEHAQCSSGHCDAGTCCAQGRCCDEVEDCSPQGEPMLSCEDPASCQGLRRDFECREHRCVASDSEDDSACDASVEASACALYVPVFCNGAVGQAAPSCPTACEADEQCVAMAHCEDGACELDAADAAACRRDGQCASGHCQGGHCCAQGDCCEDADDCPAQFRSEASCDEAATCQGSRKTASCVDAMCVSQQVGDDRACSQGVLARTCGAYEDVYCTGSEAQQAPECKANCDEDDDCDEGAHCSDGRCELDRVNGQSCSASHECVSEYCSGGFCCNAGDCCGSDDDCETEYLCVDTGTCQGVAQERTCNAAFQCEDASRRADASGCAGQVALRCGAYRDVYCAQTSAPISASCATSCRASWECSWGHTCNDGSCE